MLTIRLPLDYPKDLDEPLIERFPDPNATVGDTRTVAIQQIRQSGQQRTVSGAEREVGPCYPTDVVTLSSDARTTDGRWELDVGSIICFDVAAFGEPSIIATPVMGSPVLTSIGYALSADGRDLTIRVFTTDPDGQPVNAYFHWHAVVPLPGPQLI